MSGVLSHTNEVFLVSLLPSNIIVSVGHQMCSEALVLILSWQNIWQLLMSISLSCIVLVNNLYFSVNIPPVSINVGLDAKEHVDCVDLVLGKVHEPLLVSGVPAEVGVWPKLPVSNRVV
jgi:hypothetical protein